MLAGFLYPSAAAPIATSYFIGRSLYTYAYITHGASYYVREIGASLLFCAYASSILLVLGFPGRVVVYPYVRGQFGKMVKFFRS